MIIGCGIGVPFFLGQRRNFGLKFDGVDDIVNTSVNLSTSSHTIAAWVNKESGPSAYSAILNCDSWLGFNGADPKNTQIRWRIMIGGISTPIVATARDLSGWHHYAVSFTGTSAKLYVDGNVAGSVSGITGTMAAVTPTFGAKPGGDFFKGIIDNIKVYNRSLSDTEIASLFKGESVLNGLSYDWRFDEGSGLITRDSVSNNIGNVSGATFVAVDR